jgi:hypothetical protein
VSIDLTAAADAYSAPDDEEPDERAKRLITDRMRFAMEQERKLRKRIQLHARHLSEEDREHLAKFLRRDRDLTVAYIEDVENDLPEFSFPSDGGSW